MKSFLKFRPRSLAVVAAAAALVLPLAVGHVVAPAAQAAVTCDKTGVTSVSGKDDSVTATTYTVSVNGVQTSVCELKFDYSGVIGTDDSSVYTWNVPTEVTSIDYLLVSGGGGGGAAGAIGGSADDSYAGGGGSGGGVAFDDSVSVQGLLTVNVGAGGAGGGFDGSGVGQDGEDGEESRWFTAAFTANEDPGTGSYADSFVPGSNGNDGGNPGEKISGVYPTWSSGGGGASGVRTTPPKDGFDGIFPNGGDGAVGLDDTVPGLFGGQVYAYAGGGGGGGSTDATQNGTGGTNAWGGGTGGGPANSPVSMNGTEGAPGTGGGGGGGGLGIAAGGVGGNGGSGVVRIRFVIPSNPTPNPPAPPAPAPEMSPATQSLAGVTGTAVTPTSRFTLTNFTMGVRYSIYPSLPAGLSLDPVTGVVSGTPTQVYPPTKHWITATGGGGSESAYSVLNVSVAAAPTPPPAPDPVPVPALEPGGSYLTVDGVPQQVKVDPNKQSDGIDIVGDDFSMNLQGLDGQGQPLRLAEDGVLILNQDRQVQTTGTGFMATSEVDLYLDPPTLLTRSARLDKGTYIGTVTTDKSGSFAGTAILPPGIAVGDHVVQAVGLSKAGAVRAMSIGVRVEPSATLVLNQGTRKPDGRHDRIRTTGTSTGIPEGTKLTPYIKYSGQSSFIGGKATIVVQSDGTFTWTRQIRKDKTVTGYVTWTDIESNQVTWAKVR